MLLKRGSILYGLQCASPQSSPFFSSLFHFLSTSICSPGPDTVTGNPASKPHFAVEYLVKSWGFPMERAITLSRQISHLKSPDNPNSVLKFLNETGLSDAQIRTAVPKYPQLLCTSVDNNLKFRMKELQEMGFSPSQICQFISLSPCAFRCSNLQQKIKFWMPILGSIEMLLKLLKKDNSLLNSDLERVAAPNISFLQEHCGLSVRRIVQVSMSCAWMVTFNPIKLKDIVQRAEALGIPRSSKNFMNALIAAASLSRSRLDAKVQFLKSLGWSEATVSSMIRRQPRLLVCSEDKISSILDFLTSEVGFDMAFVARCPKLFLRSLEHCMIPRNYVLKTLRSKGLPQGRLSLCSAVNLSEQNFLEKFVLPFKDTIPGLCEAYAAACAGKSSCEK